MEIYFRHKESFLAIGHSDDNAIIAAIFYLNFSLT